jgi:peroxiredoxin
MMDSDDRLGWWAAAVANLPLPLFYAYLKSVRIARTSDNLPLLMLLSFAGSVVALWESLIAGNAPWEPAAVAVAGTVLLLLYVFWYSRFGRMPNPRLEVGNKLPDFTLTDLAGAEVRSAEFLGQPAINLFYRGSWCQFCIAQLHEIAGRHRDLEKMGIQLNLISSEPEARTRVLAADLGAPVRFLVDRDATVAHALDIAERNAAPLGAAAGFAADSAMPTVVVTNASGTILFSDQTDIYRVRPEPDIYISILRRAGAVAT